MSHALYIGHFDPPTIVHDDIVSRAQSMFDELTVAVRQEDTGHPLLPFDQRLYLAQALWTNARVRVRPARGEVPALLAETGSDLELVQFRGIGDWEEAMQASGDVPRAYLLVDAAHLPITSSLVREIARLNGDVTPFVPLFVLAHMQNTRRT